MFWQINWVATLEDGERATRNSGDGLARRGYLRLPLGGGW